MRNLQSFSKRYRGFLFESYGFFFGLSLFLITTNPIAFVWSIIALIEMNYKISDILMDCPHPEQITKWEMLARVKKYFLFALAINAVIGILFTIFALKGTINIVIINYILSPILALAVGFISLSQMRLSNSSSVGGNIIASVMIYIFITQALNVIAIPIQEKVEAYQAAKFHQELKIAEHERISAKRAFELLQKQQRLNNVNIYEFTAEVIGGHNEDFGLDGKDSRWRFYYSTNNHYVTGDLNTGTRYIISVDEDDLSSNNLPKAGFNSADWQVDSPQVLDIAKKFGLNQWLRTHNNFRFSENWWDLILVANEGKPYWFFRLKDNTSEIWFKINAMNPQDVETGVKN